VVKVESPAGDPLAAAAPAYYHELCEGQEVITLDLTQESGRRALDEHLTAADLLVTSSRPRALAKLGLAQERIRRDYPQLCHVAIVGHTGEDADLAGHDLTYQASAGLLTPPVMPTVPVADLIGAERVVGEALALLLQRGGTGVGGYREVSLAGVVAELATPLHHGLTARGGVLGGGLATYGIYRTSDGWVAVAALESHFALRLGKELGVDPLDKASLEAVFMSYNAAHWEKWARSADLPLVVVRSTRSELGD